MLGRPLHSELPDCASCVRRNPDSAEKIVSIQELVILAVPRTGTNYLCATLAKFQKSVALYELFHPDAAYGLRSRDYLISHFSLVMGQPLLDLQDRAIVRHVHKHPLRTLDEIAQLAGAAGERLLSYKIFPGHLPDATLGQLLAERRPKVLFIVRDRLPTFISMLKARTSGQWTNVDTTTLAVEAHVNEFLAWSADCDRWYAATSAMVRSAGLQETVLGYERHLDAPEPELVTTLTAALARLGIGLGEASQFIKQDRTEGIFQRISNGAEFERRLRDAGKFDYALAPPLSEDQ